MKLECVTCIRNKGDKGRVSGKPFDMLIVGCLMTTARGFEMVEITLDGDHPEPKRGQVYEAEISFYPDREKKLHHKVVALRPAAAAVKAA